ncbi:hypothetical protein CEXT_418861 [Caerostris extrusa]|uniref:Uncharacterized protein n=1 Tax=Caerostris extrusa TaxID=172846 RepID=A0AAV4X094_CAEEX|nr:hypothetical protein CEXT_418861 [Caerostris extrusa]
MPSFTNLEVVGDVGSARITDAIEEDANSQCKDRKLVQCLPILFCKAIVSTNNTLWIAPLHLVAAPVVL